MNTLSIAAIIVVVAWAGAFFLAVVFAGVGGEEGVLRVRKNGFIMKCLYKGNCDLNDGSYEYPKTRWQLYRSLFFTLPKVVGICVSYLIAGLVTSLVFCLILCFYLAFFPDALKTLKEEVKPSVFFSVIAGISMVVCASIFFSSQLVPFVGKSVLFVGTVLCFFLPFFFFWHFFRYIFKSLNSSEIELI